MSDWHKYCEECSQHDSWVACPGFFELELIDHKCSLCGREYTEQVCHPKASPNYNQPIKIVPMKPGNVRL